MTKFMTYIIPPVMFIGTAWMPAGLQWFFLMMSVGSVTQTQATINPTVRRWVGLPPLPSAEALEKMKYLAPTPTNTGMGDKIREGMTAAGKSIKEASGVTDEKARWKKAQEYEEKRAEEERQRALRRMEDARRRRADQ
jgi:YidC/Oxa1 family membrane protein insertase